MMVELGELAWMVSFADSLFFDMLHILKLIFCIDVYGRPVESQLYCFAC
jgi:predicted exporter